MKVFISWSGTRSKETAQLLHGWLNQVIQEVEAWMSDDDLAKGGDWSGDITDHLNASDFGIICVTPGNKDRPWLLFEAGALSRQMENSASRVAPLLIGFGSKSDLEYPLGRFQSTEPTYEDMFKLVKSLNERCDKPLGPIELQRSFKVWWPEFHEPYMEIERKTGESSPRRRPDREVLAEVLNVVRSLQKQVAPAPRVQTGDGGFSGEGTLSVARTHVTPSE